jgi:glycosyltransferase involved in cell wall biosynthesis
MAVVSDIATDARVRREAVALAGAGHQVDVVAFAYGITTPEHRVEDGVRYRLLPFPSRDASRWRRLAGAGRFFVRASALILRSDAEVFHSHNLHLAVPCVVRARLRRRHLVYDAHELVREMSIGWRRPLATLYERLVWRRAEAAITTNASRAAYLADLHGVEPPLVLGNFPARPADGDPTDLRTQLGIDPDRLLLIYQGGLYPAARCFETVAAALAENPAWEWVLVGFGREEAFRELDAILESAGIAERSHVLQAVPLGDLPAVTAAADAGVVPLRRTDLNNYLGDTNKLFEYLMAGIPAVGSDFPELTSAILDNPEGPVGAVFQPDDAASIGRALVEVERGLAAFKARAGRVARRHYSWDREGHKLVDLYERLEASSRAQKTERIGV